MLRGTGYRIDAEVEQRAAAELQCVEPVPRIAWQIARVIGDDRINLAERPRCHNLADTHHMREESRPRRLEHNKVFRCGETDDPARFAGVDGEGLFDQHVLAGIERHQGVFRVRGMRRRHVDDVDIAIGRERLVATVRLGNVEPCREAVGASLRAQTNGHDA